MSSLKRELTELEHVWHSADWRLSHVFNELHYVLRPCFIEEVDREHFLQIDPSLKIVRYVNLLMECFSSHLVAIEITTTHKNELSFKDTLSL